MLVALALTVTTLTSAPVFAGVDAGPVAEPASTGPVRATFTASGLKVFERSSGKLVTLTPTADSDTTMVTSTGKIAGGEVVSAIAYYEPLPEPRVEPESEFSPDDLFSYDATGDGAVDYEAETDYSTTTYSAGAVHPMVAEVSTASSVLIVASPDYLARSQSDGEDDATGEEDPPGGGMGPHAVFKNGELAGHLDEDLSFVDVDPGEGAVYELAPVEEDPDGEGGGFMLAPEAYSTLSETAPAVNNARIWLNYKTFIPTKRVSVAPGQICNPVKYWNKGTVYFNGNNRGWSSTNNSIKTRAQIEVNFSTKKINLKKWVGTPKRYENSTTTTVAESATASGKSIKLTGRKMNSKSASFTMHSKVGNPLCAAAGPIWAQVSATVYRNGSGSFYGYRYRAPNHEMYVVGSSGGTWQTVARRKLKSYLCLSLNCGQDSWTKYYNKGGIN